MVRVVAVTVPHACMTDAAAAAAERVRVCDRASWRAARVIVDTLAAAADVRVLFAAELPSVPRALDDPNRPWAVSRHGEAEIRAARDGGLVLDVHSFNGYDTPRTARGVYGREQPWGDFTLLIGVDTTFAPSVRAGERLRAALAERGLLRVALWVVHPVENKLVALAREQGTPALLLEFTETRLADTLVYARAVAQSVAASKDLP